MKPTPAWGPGALMTVSLDGPSATGLWHLRLREGDIGGDQAHGTAVISIPNLGVFAVAAAGVLCAFCCVVDTLPEQCLVTGNIRG